MEDRKNLKEYREIYKGKKDEYTLWKRKVSEEIAVTEKSELLNMKKTYEIKLKKEKHMDEKDYLAAYNSNILVILISLLTAFATMFVENPAPVIGRGWRGRSFPGQTPYRSKDW